MNAAVAVPASRPRPRLVVRYLLLSLLVTAVVTLAVSLTAHGIVSNDLKRKDRALAEQAAQFVWDQLHEHWLDPLAAGRITETRPQSEVVDAIIRRVIGPLNITRANLIDGNGHVLYSTELAWRGKQLEDAHELEEVLKGFTVSNLKEDGSTFDLGGTADDALLETYVLVGSLELPGRPSTAAIVELYQVADDYMAELRRSQRLVIAIAITCLTAMFFAHLWLFVQGNRTIVARTQELEQFSARLEDLVDERTRELTVSRRLADVGQMAAGVAHEVNTPLASIATCAEGLLRRTADADVKRYLEIIRKEAYRVKTITRDLLEFSKLQAQPEASLRLETVRIVTVLREIGDLLAFSMTERRVKWDVLVGEDVKVRADPMALHQILLNLSTNCLDALPDGGDIRWVAEEVGENVRLRCTDNGVGIEPDLLEHVMDPFVSTKRHGQGTGLGLSVAYALARRQGGALTIDSPGRGKGTVTTLVLMRA